MSGKPSPSARLRTAAVSSGQRRSQITIGAVIDNLGDETPTTLLLFLATAALVPGPAPVFAVAIMLLAVILLTGREEIALPERLRNWKISARGIERMSRYLEPLERRFGLDRDLPPVPQPLVRAAAVATIIDALLIMVPIPLGNVPSAFAAMLLGLGLVGGNRTALLLGAAATAVSVVLVSVLLWVGLDLLHAFIRHV